MFLSVFRYKITASRTQKQKSFVFVEAPRNLSKITASRTQKQNVFCFSPQLVQVEDKTR